MRYAILFLAACSPDIATGVYFCGAEQSCPDGFYCDAETVSCINSDTAKTYSCVSSNATMATADALGNVTCGVNPIEDKACTTKGGEAWYAFTVMAGCTVQVDAQVEVASPLAFAPLTVELRDATGATVIATATSGCPKVSSSDVTGEYAYCLTQTLTPATSYLLRVVPTGEANCGGDCDYNDYRLRITSP